MATITNREDFTNYCLRRLGAPVIDINVDPDQVQDRIDDALQYWQDYHFDGLQKVYYIKKVLQSDIDQKYLDLSNVIVTGNVIPSATNTYSLGSTDAGWKDVVVSNHVVYSKSNTAIGSTATSVIDSFDKTVYRSGKYLIQSTGAPYYECYEALVIHDSASNVYVTVYGVTNTGNALGNITANVVSNTVQLLYTAYSSNVYVKASAQLHTL